MADHVPTTRRRIVRSTLGLAGLGTGAGCLGGIDATGTPSASAKSPPPTESPTSDLTSPPPGDRQYADYVPHHRLDWERYLPGSTSADLAAAKRHEPAFGDAFGDYGQAVLGGVPLAVPKDATLSISHTLGGAIVGRFSKRPYHVLFRNDDLVDRVGRYRGFELHRDRHRETHVALAEGVALAATEAYDRGTAAIKNHVDVVAGRVPSYYRRDPHYNTVVTHLPQGIYTTVFRGKPASGPALDTVAAGQTIHFDGDRSPATGRTVLRFDDTVADPLATTRHYVERASRLWNQPFADPTVARLDDRMVVVEDAVDPATVFASG